MELAELLDAGRTGTAGVGGSPAQVDLDGTPVFAKRIPLTDRELTHPRSTANLFDLPMFCQYGIGSPGFNAWRELAANMIVTDAGLAGETESFPLLYHWRILPGRPPIAAEHAETDTAVAALGGSPRCPCPPPGAGYRAVQPRVVLRVHSVPHARLVGRTPDG
ncbi:MAG: hypothetical protein WKF76_04810 [Nocardioidaceae bacterium]